MDLEELTAFLAVTEHGSFSAASTAAGMSRTTLRRRVEALEARAGVPLIERKHNGIVATEAGALIAQRGREIMQETTAMLEAIQGEGDDTPGILRIAAIPASGPYLGPMVGMLQQELKNLRINARLVDEPALDLLDGADVAIHFGDCPSGPWLSEVLMEIDERLYASSGYLDEHGTPTDIASLDNHRLMTLTGGGEPSNRWPKVAGGEFPIMPVLASPEVGIVCHCLREGGGIALLPQQRGQHERLVEVLSDIVGTRRALRVTVPERLANLRKVEATRSLLRRLFAPSQKAPPPAQFD